MTPRNAALKLSLPAALAVVLAAMVRPDPVAPARGVVAEIAVVDLDRVLKNYPGARDKERELIEMGQGFDVHMQELRSQLDALEGARAGYEEGTPEFLDADLQARLKALEFEKTAERFDLLAQRKGADVRLELYDELKRGIAEFAKARDLKLVLRVRKTGEGDGRTVRLQSNQAADLLFYDQTVDVTEPVIQFLKTWK